jgi:hypothetical protein
MDTSPDPLTALILRSALVSDERKERLLQSLPLMTEAQRGQLKDLLASEAAAVPALAQRIIRGAEDRGNTQGMVDLGEATTDAMRTLRANEEEASDPTAGQLDSLLDQA